MHTTLQDLLPAGSYFRFNTLMSEDFLLDENRPDKLDQLQQEALDFVSINELRIMQAAGVLTREKSSLQKATDWIKLQKDIYRWPVAAWGSRFCSELRIMQVAGVLSRKFFTSQTLLCSLWEVLICFRRVIDSRWPKKFIHFSPSEIVYGVQSFEVHAWQIWKS